jgi:vancomycin resistance protein VanJ
MQDSIAPPSRAAATFTLFTCLLYTLALAIVAALIWTLADRWWPATVLSFAPRWVLATPLALLLPMSIRWHRRSILTLIAAGALLTWPILGLHIPWPSKAGDPQSPFLRVVTCNIHGRQLNASEFKGILDELHPDVVALQDYSAHGRESLFPPDQWTTRRDGELFLASRYPITQAQIIPLAEPPPVTFRIRLGAAAYYRLQTPLGAFNLINLHLSSVHSALDAMRDLDPTSPMQVDYNTRCRDMESSTVEQFAATIGDPVVILGDFNTPRESSLYQLYWDHFNNAFSTVGFGFGSTHISTESSVRIDHILFGDGWRARSCWIAPAAGSPHRPLVADLELDGRSSIQDADAGR